MKKIQSTAVGLLIGASCGMIAWVANTPPTWRQPAAPSARLAPARETSKTSKSRSSAEFAVHRQEAEVLPLVAKQVSLQSPVVEAPSLAPEECFDLTSPAAPDLPWEGGANLADDSRGEATDVAPAWPVPASLLLQLDALTEVPASRDWAIAVKAKLEDAARWESLDAPQAGVTLANLAELAGKAKKLGESLAPAEEQALLHSAAYALSRRLEVWESVHHLASRPDATTIPVAARPEAMLARVDAVDAILGQGGRSSEWRRYLLTGQTRLLAEAGSGGDKSQRRRHAQRVLRRIEWPGLTDGQQQFLKRPEFLALADELRAWAAEPFDFAHLLQSLEEYEQQPTALLASRIAEVRRRLSWAGGPQEMELSRRLDEHYRNGNIRFSLSLDLLQRLAPPITTTLEAVRDTIAGAAIRGQSEVTSRVTFRLTPDERRLRLTLVASGETLNDTRSSKSGAVFHSRGQAWFNVEKEVVFDGDHVTLGAAIGDAQVQDSLRGVATDFDNLPLVNVLARSIATREREEAVPQARREAEQKVVSRAASRLDAQAQQRVADLEGRVADRIGKPLATMTLLATPVGLQTTSSRLIGRYRLAGDMQLGAHTVRPLAPGDSAASVQLHESAVNNLLAQLPVAGRDVELPTLFGDILRTLGLTSVAVPEDLPKNVTVRLQEEDPVRVVIDGGRAQVTIRLAPHKTRERPRLIVTARAYYEPEVHGLSARLVRRGTVELTGDHLHIRDQVALRAIFSKVFAERRALPLLPAPIAESDRLRDYAVTQVALRDGWLGVAIGHDRSSK